MLDEAFVGADQAAGHDPREGAFRDPPAAGAPGRRVGRDQGEPEKVLGSRDQGAGTGGIRPDDGHPRVQKAQADQDLLGRAGTV